VYFLNFIIICVKCYCMLHINQPPPQKPL
jgi:hypothetical protein